MGVIVDSGYCSFQMLLQLKNLEDQDISLYMMAAITGKFNKDWMINSCFWLQGVKDTIGVMATIKLGLPSHITLARMYEKD